MDVEGSAANAAGVTSQEYLTRYRGSLSRGKCTEAQKPASPCMPSASDCDGVGATQKKDAGRCERPPSPPAGGRDLALPSAQRARGGGELGENRDTQRTHNRMGAIKSGRCAPAPPNVPPFGGPDGGMPPCGGGAEADAGGGPALPVGNRGRGPRLPCPAPCGRGRRRAARAWIARLVRATIRIKGGPLARRAAYLKMSRSRLWRQGTMSVARMGLAPMPPTRTAVCSVGRRDAAGRPCHGSRRARVHPWEDAQSGGRAVANASARGDANEKASAVAQRPPMRIRRGASRRPTDGGCPDRGAPSSRPAGRFPPAGDGPRPAPLYLIQGQNSVKTQ